MYVRRVRGPADAPRHGTPAPPKLPVRPVRGAPHAGKVGSDRDCDLARAMRDSDVTAIGGFQTRMEKECLPLLLRGIQSEVAGPSCGIENMRVPCDSHSAFDDGCLLTLAPFPATVRRPTAHLAAQPNDLAASSSSRDFVVHAAPGSRTEAFARKLAASRELLLTLDSAATGGSVEMETEAIGPTYGPTLSPVDFSN